jgi:folate-binding protein YgfZ
MSVDPILHVPVEGSYRGAAAPASFGDSRAEYLSLRQGCGVFAMPWRAKLIVTGNDRVRWLNGMVTNNVRDLQSDRGVYAFLLTAQGRIIADMDVYQRGEYLLVVSDLAQMKTICDTFDHFIIMDDVELKDLTDKLASVGVVGPKSRAVLATAGLTLPQLEPMQVKNITWNAIGVSIARSGNPNYEAYEIWLAPENAPKLQEALTAAEANPVGYEALEMLRISMGVPAYGKDIRERDLPQETNQSHALHFVKGCYVGQEIVERIRARGAVHRGFAGFLMNGDIPSPGTKVQAGGKDVGEITSAARVPTDSAESTIALGYLRREAGGPGTEVQIGGASARVSELPFQI